MGKSPPFELGFKLAEILQLIFVTMQHPGMPVPRSLVLVEYDTIQHWRVHLNRQEV